MYAEVYMRCTPSGGQGLSHLFPITFLYDSTIECQQ
jgi:hypothetical protein